MGFRSALVTALRRPGWVDERYSRRPWGLVGRRRRPDGRPLGDGPQGPLAKRRYGQCVGVVGSIDPKCSDHCELQIVEIDTLISRLENYPRSCDYAD